MYQLLVYIVNRSIPPLSYRSILMSLFVFCEYLIFFYAVIIVWNFGSDSLTVCYFNFSELPIVLHFV